jgi:hypothetical protein
MAASMRNEEKSVKKKNLKPKPALVETQHVTKPMGNRATK